MFYITGKNICLLMCYNGHEYSPGRPRLFSPPCCPASAWLTSHSSPAASSSFLWPWASLRVFSTFYTPSLTALRTSACLAASSSRSPSPLKDTRFGTFIIKKFNHNLISGGLSGSQLQLPECQNRPQPPPPPIRGSSPQSRAHPQHS